MNWPLKIHGRFLTKTDVNEVRKLLQGNKNKDLNPMGVYHNYEVNI